MKKDIINRPLKSSWIGGLYTIALIFVATLYLAISLIDSGQEPLILTASINVTMILALLLMLVTTVGFYTTRYTIRDGILYSWSPFMTIRIRLSDIKSVEKIMVPFHIRVGASLYSGFFYVPDLGWVMSIITNLRDAILITTKNGKYYMITPSNPKTFMRMLK